MKLKNHLQFLYWKKNSDNSSNKNPGNRTFEKTQVIVLKKIEVIDRTFEKNSGNSSNKKIR